MLRLEPSVVTQHPVQPWDSFLPYLNSSWQFCLPMAPTCVLVTTTLNSRLIHPTLRDPPIRGLTA